MLIRRADCTTLIEVQLAAAAAVPTSVDERCMDVSCEDDRVKSRG